MMVDLIVMPVATSQNINALLTMSKVRIVETMTIIGMLGVTFDFFIRDESSAVFKASPEISAVEIKTP